MEPKEHSQLSEQVRSTLRGLKDDPDFRHDLERIQQRVRDALMQSGLSKDQFEVGVGDKGSPGGHAERIPDHYECLLMLFDECWFWVKVH